MLNQLDAPCSTAASAAPVCAPMPKSACTAAAPPQPDDGAYQYVGSELDLFATALHWKSYLRRQIVPHVGRSVLEVGAGLGATTRALWHSGVADWLSLEPDASLAGRYQQACDSGQLPAACRVQVGTTVDMAGEESFDTVLYIDVLEHIEDDRAELQRAARLLMPGGKLIVLSPAHQWLFSAFDRMVGHYRRYSRAALAALTPSSLSLIRLASLDSAGMLASLGNRFLLRQSIPTVAQIDFWNKVLVPASRLLDPVCGYHVGKSVLAVWQRPSLG